ncbi:hypothetical protein ACWCP6_27345 [Streptomyces sp. NPDC002004]
MRSTQDGSAADVVRAILAQSRPADGADTLLGAADAALRAVEETRPARTVATAVTSVGGIDDHAAGRLRELVERHLAGSPERWLGAHDALAGHRGTLPALLANVPPPAPSPAPGELRPPAPRSVHTTLALLLEHARPEHAANALAALPDRTLEALLAGGTMPGPGLVTAVIEHGDSRSRVSLARHPRLDTRVLSRLLATGDPRVGAAVYRSPRATQSLRRALAHRLDSVPMDETLRAELTDPSGDPPRTWLAPLLGSGDPQLVARALTVGPRGVAQQYALVRVWERTGPGAVRTLLDDRTVVRHLGRPVVSAVTDALAEDDGSGRALLGLRERCEPYADPARLPELLATTRGTSSLRDLMSEPYVHDLDALSEAHGKTPFMPKACEELARHEAASDAQRLAFRLSVLNEPWRAGGRRAGNNTPPTERLAEEPLDTQAARWADGMVTAGLLDPVELIRIARPAAHAVTALAGLAERKLLSETAVAELRSLADDHLGERPATWAALDALLPAHRGTLRELIAEAGRTAPDDEDTGGEASADPGADDRVAAHPEQGGEPHPLPRGRHGRAALAALDLLRSVAPADAPLPTDPDVLRFLAGHDGDDAPGLATPEWLVQACAAHGTEPLPSGRRHTAPTLAEVRAERPQTWGSSARLTERAYTQGILPADELPALLPARRMIRLPHDWRRLAFAEAWRGAVARLFRAELGGDAAAWLRLAETASAAAEPVDDVDSDGPSWVELLSLARSGNHAGPPPGERTHAEGGTDGHRSPQAAASAVSTPRPRTPDEAIGLLERGNHLWAWPVGTLLCLADGDVVDAALPRLGPDGPWLLAAYLLRHDRTPRTVFERLLTGRDPRALHILARQSRRLDAGLVDRLVDLEEPDVDLALLRSGCPTPLARRIVARSRPRAGADTGGVGALVLAELRADPSARPVGGLHWLGSAEPDLIEEVFLRMKGEANFAEQVNGCLHLVEHGGTQRLAALAARELLGQAATKLCVKALASGDPVAVIRARLDRELAPAKLVARLRRARHPWQVTSAMPAVPDGVDWGALEAAHEQEPLPHWERLVNHPDAPAHLRMRYAVRVREPGPHGLADGVELTRARARHGLGGLYHCPLTTQLDGLLTSGNLTGADLLHLAAPAALMLAYLGAAARRTDAPAEAGTALSELAGLVRTRLGTDEEGWARVAGRLTGRDPGWEPISPVVELLT